MPRAGLNPDTVVDVALTLIDEKGLDALTLAAVADRAGVAAPSLYKHVGSLADLRDLMAVRIIREITGRFTGAVMGRSRGDAVEALMREHRAYAVAYPHRYALMPLNPLGQPALQPAARELFAVFVAVMRGYGLTDADATHAIRRLRATVHGFAALESGGGFGLPEDIDTTYDQLVATFLRSLP
jgi:AcrR family transcriptional regulator